MPKKQKFTNAEIEKDIVTALKNPPSMSKETYQKPSVSTIIVVCVFLVLEFIYPHLLVWLLLALLVWGIATIIFHYIRLRQRIKRVSINDYHITIETVHGTSVEHYRAHRGRFRSETVFNYMIQFENGKVWRIPKENYLWSDELSISDWGICQGTQCGNTFVVVTKKDTGEIVTAYNTEYFEYRV